MKEKIKAFREVIKRNCEDIKWYKGEAERCKRFGYDNLVRVNKSRARAKREENKRLRGEINAIKFIMGM